MVYYFLGFSCLETSRPLLSYLSQGARGDDVVHPLHCQAPAQLYGLHVALACAGKGGEEEAHGQGIVNITQGIDERGVPEDKKHEELSVS